MKDGPQRIPEGYSNISYAISPEEEAGAVLDEKTGVITLELVKLNNLGLRVGDRLRIENSEGYWHATVKSITPIVNEATAILAPSVGIKCKFIFEIGSQ